MARLRVKAYFMHEHEQEAAEEAEKDSLIEQCEWTPGYVMGVVDESAIEGLKKMGLVVTAVEMLEEPAGPETEASFAVAPGEIATLGGGTINTHFLGAARPFSIDKLGAPSALSKALPNTPGKQKVLSYDRRKPQFYVVRFHGSITRARKALLERHKIELLERVTRNRYTARLAPAQVKQLAALDFVDWLRLYDSIDTLRTERLEAGAPPAETEAVAFSVGATVERPRQRMAVFAVRVHRKVDLPIVVRWLAKRKVKPLWRGPESLRVALETPGRDLDALTRMPEVAYVEEQGTAQLLGDCAQQILGIPTFRKGPAASQLRGAGEIIGIADTGLDDTHPDFKGRVLGLAALGRKGITTDPEGHGTHVAGCAAGDGSASGGKIVGAAPAAKIYFQSILDANGGLGGLPDDLATMFRAAYQKGVRIHNNSWGAFAFANYSTTSLQVDKFVFDHPDMLIVIAAGNDGIAVPRKPGASMNSTPGSVDWPSVAAPGTSKNAITVGASCNSRTSLGFANLTWGAVWASRYPQNPVAGEKISGNDQALAAFSSRGPCTDLRIKPDLVAPGTDIAAARSSLAPLRKFWGAYPSTSLYGLMGGTSMAAPYVAGCAALVREWYRKVAKHERPSAALLKATLINGTVRITHATATAGPMGSPNYHQGFGRVNLPTTLPNSSVPRMALRFADTWTNAKDAIPNDDRVRFQVRVAAGTPLRICLAWTDPPARALQNSLALLVDDGGTNKGLGNADAAAVLKVSGAPQDPQNNVQTVRVEKPAAGTYTIAIMSSLMVGETQHFALVVTGDLGSPLSRI